MKVIFSNKKKLKENKILTEASTAPAEVIKLLELLKDADVSLTKVCSATLNFVNMPDAVKHPLQKLFNLLRSSGDSEELVTAAEDLGKVTEEWYGNWKTESDFVWKLASACRKKVKGAPNPMLGQTGQGVLLNRPKEAYKNSSYDGYKTHIDYAHALLKYGFGYGDDCLKRNVYNDQINIARCLNITIDSFKLFKELYDKATAAHSTISSYAEKIRSSSWTDAGANGTKGPEHFNKAIATIEEMLKLYGSNVKAALGSNMGQYGASIPARDITPKALTYISSISSALDAVTTWIGQESSHDDKIEKDAAHTVITNKSGIDWTKAYAKAAEESPDAAVDLLNKYYATEWADWSATIKSLGTPFIQEVQQLGFGNNNPFIYFLRELVATCESSDHGLSSNKEKVKNNLARLYPAIHNAYIQDYISAEDLAGSGILAKNNLLFCPAIYNSPIILKEYLQRQKEVLSKISAGTFASKKLKAMYSKVLFCFAKIFFDNGNSDSIKLAASGHDIIEDSDWDAAKCTEVIQTKPLRSIAVIDEHIQEVFGSADQFSNKETPSSSASKNTTKKELEVKDLKDLISKMTPEEKEELKNLLN